MKKFLLFLCIFLFLGQMAYASTIYYDIAGAPSSSVTLTDNTTTNKTDELILNYGIPGYASITGQLVSGLEDTTGKLGDGQSVAIDFFTLTVSGSGIIKDSYDISATLSFQQPVGISASGDGGGLYGVADLRFLCLGKINGGTLDWNNDTLPDYFALSDGTTLKVDFEEGIAIGLGTTATVHAFLTKSGSATAPVPEPATMLLLGTGLLGLAGASRKKLFKK